MLQKIRSDEPDGTDKGAEGTVREPPPPAPPSSSSRSNNPSSSSLLAAESKNAFDRDSCSMTRGDMPDDSASSTSRRNCAAKSSRGRLSLNCRGCAACARPLSGRVTGCRGSRRDASSWNSGSIMVMSARAEPSANHRMFCRRTGAFLFFVTKTVNRAEVHPTGRRSVTWCAVPSGRRVGGGAAAGDTPR